MAWTSRCKHMDLNEWGDFLAGVAGPLALLWLVLGYYQQQKELRQNTAALGMQRRELKRGANSSNEQVKILMSANSAHVLPNVSLQRLDEDGHVLEHGPFEGKHYLLPVVTIKNYGNMPARDVAIQVYYQPLVAAPTSGMVPDRTIHANWSSFLLPPGDSVSPLVRGDFSEADLTQTPCGAPDNPDYAIWITLEYRDLHDDSVSKKKVERFKFVGGVVVDSIRTSGNVSTYLSTSTRIESKTLTADDWPSRREISNAKF